MAVAEDPGEVEVAASARAADPSAPRLRGRRAGLLAVLGAVVLLLPVALVVAGRAGGTADRPGWTLVLREDFDADTLDGQLWNAQDVPSPRNHELEHYTPELVSLADGRLRLSSERVARGDLPFSSAAVDTYGKFSFTYGRVEVRAQLPAMGPGLWPAVWLLGTGCNPVGPPCAWPTAGSNEIDVMEAVGDPGLTYTNLHHGTVVRRSLSTGSRRHPAPDLTTRFHTFAVEWEPGGVVRWYRDDELLEERAVPGSFDRPMYLILNTAVGGDWPGPPTAATPFPQHFDVDFVRVYQRS